MPRRERDWAAYELWNIAVASEFFDTRNKDRPVYIDLEDEVLDRIAREIEIPAGRRPLDALRDAVRATLDPLDEPRGTFASHLDEVDRWRRSHLSDTPPCIALLAIFVMAAESMKTDSAFSSLNYYGRLAEEVGLGDRSEAPVARLRTQFQRYSHAFWDALRDWLLLHNGELGLPSAEAFDYRSHIGLPMSQALVRAADRARFADMFGHYRLRPGQLVAAQDMQEMLGAWIPHAAVSKSLQRLWTRQDAARRIASVACLELQAWDGTTQDKAQGTNQSRHAPLLLLASIGSVPRAFRLALRLPRHASLPCGKYELDPQAVIPAREALRYCGGYLTLERGLGGTLRLREAARISYPDLLICSLSLHHRDQSELSRQGGRVVVFERDEETRELVETSSVDLGAELWILCHQSIAARLSKALQQGARQGWQAITPGDLAGIPDGWILFRDVQLLRSPSLDTSTDYELQALAPVSRTHIYLGGGFSLPGRGRWHSALPPEIRLTSDRDGRLKAHLRTLWSPHAVEREQVLGTFLASGVFPLASTKPPDGDYQVSIQEAEVTNETPVMVSSFSLRSASSSLPRLGEEALDWIGRATTSRTTDGRFGLSAAERNGTESVAIEVNGFSIKGDPLLVTARGGTEGWSISDLSAEDDRAALYEDSTATNTVARSVSRDSCIITGSHIYRIPTYSPGRARVLREHTGTCKFCGDSKVWRRASRGRRPDSRNRSGEAKGSALKPQVEPTLPRLSTTTSHTPSPDLLLDAISYVRSGTFATYSSIAQQACDDPWYSSESIYDLSSLGHVEFKRDPDTMQISSWAICAPTLVVDSASGEAFLAGARSDRLLAALHERCQESGLAVTTTEMAGAPSRIKIRGVTLDKAEELASRLPDVQGLRPRVSLDPGLRLAQACPSLSEVVRACPKVNPASAREFREFDPAVARWTDSTSLELGGAYLLPGSPKITCFYGRDLSNTARLFVADYRVVKHAAAAARRLLLARYDHSSQRLFVPLGCRLPDLYERSATAGSGALALRTAGRLTYQNVKAEVAEILLRQLAR